ncbi:MAG: VCBS repeat-containing protein, partial [Candidatus Coatesbacteria bacterium]
MVKWFLIIIVVFPLVALAGFTEEPQFGAWRTQSMNWADLDLDGDPDLAEQNSDGQDNYLYLNRNDGTFAEVALPMEGWSSTCTAWGDCDNVNGPDLAVGCNPYPRANFIFVNDGAGNFEKRPELGTTVPSGIAWADYDLDGDLDVAIVTRSGTVSEMGIYLYINDGDGYFTERFINYAGGCDIVAWGDCDNDGDPDLAVGRRSMFQNYLLINNGHGDFELTEQFGTGETTSFALGDYDNDGDLDMAVTNSAPAAGAGSNYLYTNLGHCVFSGQKEFGTLEEYSSWSIAWADYDNDGDLDAAVGNAHEPQNTLYVNGGNGSFAVVQEFGEGSTYSVSWADYDLDGDLDLAAGNFGWGAQSYLYVNDENDGDYLSVHLEGRF